MKKYNLEATNENVLDSIMKDSLQRTPDVKDFISLLDTIDYNAFIAIDGEWGNGKTFFVRQIELTLSYYSKKLFGKGISEREESAFTNNQVLKNLEIQHSYVPVYFNAWLYDNHNNALMAILFVAIRQYQKFVNTHIDSTKGEKICSILDSIQFWKNSNWEGMRDKFVGKDILEETLLMEDVREIVKEVFIDLRAEEGEKLIIFIDELDRCRPTFAVEVLESIKHYFDDDRIIFVMSVNKSQLVHTIENYYGNGFNSSGYLNRFFDINIQLPIGNNKAYLMELDLMCDDSYWLTQIANELQCYYKLSLRDMTLYYGKITSIVDNYRNKITGDNWHIMMLFIPIICILDIVDVKRKSSVLIGNDWDYIKQTIDNNDNIKRYVSKLVNNRGDVQESYNDGIEELSKIYKFIFAEDNQYGFYEGKFEIRRDFKKFCLKICNEM